MCLPLSPHLPRPRVHTGLAKAEDKSRIHRAKKQEGPAPEDMRKKVPAPTSAVSKEVPAPMAHPAPGGGCRVAGHWPGLDCGVDLEPRGQGAERGPWALCLVSRASGSPCQPLRSWPCPTGGPEEQWQRAIHERGEAVCPTCSVVTRKTLVGLKKHMEVCQKVRSPLGFLEGRRQGQLFMGGPLLQLQDALKCQHCRKQFKSKACLNYHTMAEHSAKVCHWAQLPSSPDH